MAEWLIDATSNHTITASDNTEHTLRFNNGIISVMNGEGHVVCEFFAEDLPRVDAEKVVHAHWRDDTFCSHCGYYSEDFEGHIVMSVSARCPKCGAYMDENTA